jgi:hypothetical protein
MVAGAIAGNISAEATTPTGNIFSEAMRGPRGAVWLPADQSAAGPRLLHCPELTT